MAHAGGKVLCTDYDTDKTTTLVRYDSDHYGVQSFQVFGDVMVVRGHRQKYIKKDHYMGSKGYIYLIHLKKKRDYEKKSVNKILL